MNGKRPDLLYHAACRNVKTGNSGCKSLGRATPCKAIVFKPIRIEVNGELSGLRQAIGRCRAVSPRRELCVITFIHWRIELQKQLFRELENPCTCPPKAPICICGKKPVVRILTKKPLIGRETAGTRRKRPVRSAKLRAIRKNLDRACIRQERNTMEVANKRQKHSHIPLRRGCIRPRRAPPHMRDAHEAVAPEPKTSAAQKPRGPRPPKVRSELSLGCRWACCALCCCWRPLRCGGISLFGDCVAIRRRNQLKSDIESAELRLREINDETGMRGKHTGRTGCGCHALA